MTCQTNIPACTESSIGYIFKPMTVTYNVNRDQVDLFSRKLEFSKEVFFNNGVQQKKSLDGKIFFRTFKPRIDSPFADEKLKKNATITIEPVSLDYLRTVDNKLNQTLGGVARGFYEISEFNLPLHITLRSSAVNITSYGRFDDNDYFYLPFSVFFTIDLIKKRGSSVSDLKNYICLGRINNRDNSWNCMSRKIKNLPDGYEGITNNKFQYDIMGPGIYAVIFLPALTDNLRLKENCGLLCRYKQYVITFAFIILPIMLIVGTVIFKYFMLRFRQAESEKETGFTREKLKEMEKVTAAFKGQSLKEKLEDNMEYMQNPLQGKTIEDLDDINKLNSVIQVMEMDLREIDDVKKKLLAKTKKQVQRIGVLRDDIENLATNRFDQDIGLEYQPTGNYY